MRIRGMEHVLQSQAERAGPVWPGEEKASKNTSLQPSGTFWRLIKRREREFLYERIVTGQGEMV